VFGLCAVIVIAVIVMAYVIISSPEDVPHDSKRQSLDATALEEKYPTSGGQQMRPRF